MSHGDNPPIENVWMTTGVFPPWLWGQLPKVVKKHCGGCCVCFSVHIRYLNWWILIIVSSGSPQIQWRVSQQSLQLERPFETNLVSHPFNWRSRDSQVAYRCLILFSVFHESQNCGGCESLQTIWYSHLFDLHFFQRCSSLKLLLKPIFHHGIVLKDSPLFTRHNFPSHPILFVAIVHLKILS